ncbi:MAG: Ig-like domain-containing protein [Clostridia bacterium]|nr:Ig-like domain-containing protein [Clostridia bacterium]
MKTAYGKLTVLIAVLIAGTLLFAPMRFGTEDHLYAHPRSVRMNPGDSYALSYRLDSDVPQAVSYASTNEAVATVDRNGLVTAVNGGRAQIRLDAENGARASVQIEVKGAKVDTLALNTDTLTMEKGQITGLRPIFNEGAVDTSVTWRSADETVAQVDAIGRVVAVGGGNTRVTATATNGLTASAEVSVHVSGDALRIMPEEVTVGAGTYVRLGTYYLPADTTDEVVSWASSDESVLQVQDSALYAAGVGTAILSAFSRDGLGTSAIVTVEPPAADFTISPAAATIDRGRSLTLEPRFLDENGNVDENSSEHYVTWTSSNPAVATVENGVVTAVGSGQARISASADGKIASSLMDVRTLVEGVALNLDRMYVLREDTVMPIQLEATVIPADADNTRLTWTADNDLVATVNQRGRVTLVGGYGTATITATAESGAQARFTVNVVAELPEGYEKPDRGEE